MKMKNIARVLNCPVVKNRHTAHFYHQSQKHTHTRRFLFFKKTNSASSSLRIEQAQHWGLDFNSTGLRYKMQLFWESGFNSLLRYKSGAQARDIHFIQWWTLNKIQYKSKKIQIEKQGFWRLRFKLWYNTNLEQAREIHFIQWRQIHSIRWENYN